jgi:hypothetical protein
MTNLPKNHNSVVWRMGSMRSTIVSPTVVVAWATHPSTGRTGTDEYKPLVLAVFAPCSLLALGPLAPFHPGTPSRAHRWSPPMARTSQLENLISFTTAE